MTWRPRPARRRTPGSRGSTRRIQQRIVARRRRRDLGAGEERHDVDDEHRPPAPLGWRRRLRRRVRRGAVAGVRARARRRRGRPVAGVRSDAAPTTPGVQDPLGAARPPLPPARDRARRALRRRGAQPRRGGRVDAAVHRRALRRVVRPLADARRTRSSDPTSRRSSAEMLASTDGGLRSSGSSPRGGPCAATSNVLFVHFTDLKREPEAIGPSHRRLPRLRRRRRRVARRSSSTRRSSG